MLLALAAVVIGLAASTAPAQAYPAASCQIAVKPQHVQPGHSFTVSGHSDISEQWTVTFQGSSRSFVGSTFSTTLRAPATAGTYRLGVSCSGANGSLAQQFGIQVASAAGSLTHGSLPNTGGPPWWWLLVGLGAVVSGGILVRRGRSRTVAGGQEILGPPQ